MAETKSNEDIKDRSLSLYEILAPIDTTIIWEHERIPISVHLLTNVETRRKNKMVSHFEDAEKDEVEEVIRVAMSLTKMGNHDVREDYPSEEERISWVQRWPESLVKAVCLAYQYAETEPFEWYREMEEDPNSVAALYSIGNLESAAWQQNMDTLPPTNGPSSQDTP